MLLFAKKRGCKIKAYFYIQSIDDVFKSISKRNKKHEYTVLTNTIIRQYSRLNRNNNYSAVTPFIAQRERVKC